MAFILRTPEAAILEVFQDSVVYVLFGVPLVIHNYDLLKIVGISKVLARHVGDSNGTLLLLKVETQKGFSCFPDLIHNPYYLVGRVLPVQEG